MFQNRIYSESVAAKNFRFINNFICDSKCVLGNVQQKFQFESNEMITKHSNIMI